MLRTVWTRVKSFLGHALTLTTPLHRHAAQFLERDSGVGGGGLVGSVCDWLFCWPVTVLRLLMQHTFQLQSQDTHHPHSVKQEHISGCTRMLKFQIISKQQSEKFKVFFFIAVFFFVFLNKACSRLGSLDCTATGPNTGIKPLLKALSEDRKHTNCSNDHF